MTASVRTLAGKISRIHFSERYNIATGPTYSLLLMLEGDTRIHTLNLDALPNPMVSMMVRLSKVGDQVTIGVAEFTARTWANETLAGDLRIPCEDYNLFRD